ncbi:MAG: class IV adenylate cyclase [Candidatus Paceibacterota bacterium]
MQEIEIKAILKDRAGVMARLAELDCVFSDPVHQEDRLYVEQVGTIEAFLTNKVFLRVRVNNGCEVIFTAKTRKGDLVAMEREVKVASREQMEQILLLMGFQRFNVVRKVRQTTHYNGCEICIDEVEGLGSFIEMEKLSVDGNPQEIQEELFTFFETLGIARSDRVTKGYDILMFEKQQVG